MFLKKKKKGGGENIFENYAAETIKCNLGKIFAARKKGPPLHICCATGPLPLYICHVTDHGDNNAIFLYRVFIDQLSNY